MRPGRTRSQDHRELRCAFVLSVSTLRVPREAWRHTTLSDVEEGTSVFLRAWRDDGAMAYSEGYELRYTQKSFVV